MGIPAHPYANLFPMLSPADADALRDDIAANGLRERIVILDGQILDGRNRYLALYGFTDEGLPPEGDERWISQFRRFVPAQDGDPLAWVLSKNLHRRHLSESQRAMVAAKLESFRHGGARQNSSEQDANLRLDRKGAADALHVSERSVNSAREVIDHGAPELVAKVDAGEVAVSAAAEVAKLPVSEQLRIIREQHPREFRKAVKEHRGEVQAEKKERRQEREAELGARQRALPSTKYGVILADPEWEFTAWSEETGMDRAPDNHYPTSSTDVIASRPVGDIAADDSILLLWATAPRLPDALQVMAAWGFEYVTHAIWAKDRAGAGRGPGYWFTGEHELVLLGKRGKIPAPAQGTQFRSLFHAPVGEHSEKPANIHEVAEAYFPSLPKIELNARARREGWDAWGLEAPVDDEDSQNTPEEFGTARKAPDGQPLPGDGDIGGLKQEAQPAPRSPMPKAEALEIIKARYTGDNGHALADELGRPIATIRKWAWEAGVSDPAHRIGQAMANLDKINSGKEKAS
jgi:N6-adenosine-specific RNA methylase IME4